MDVCAEHTLQPNAKRSNFLLHQRYKKYESHDQHYGITLRFAGDQLQMHF